MCRLIKNIQFLSKPIVLVLCIGGCGCGCDAAPDRHEAVAESASPNRFGFHRLATHVFAAQRLCRGRRCHGNVMFCMCLMTRRVVYLLCFKTDGFITRSLLLRLIASVQAPPLTSRPLSLTSPSFPPQHSIWVLFTTATPSLLLHLPPKTHPLAYWGRGVCYSCCRSGKPVVKFAWLLPLLPLPLICTRVTCMLCGTRQRRIIPKRKARHGRAARRCACTGGERTSKRIVLNVLFPRLLCFYFKLEFSFAQCFVTFVA
jgi:hypothetical protein